MALSGTPFKTLSTWPTARKASVPKRKIALSRR
jgi:hypothetical protein